MKESSDSDRNLAMLASNAFEQIIDQIRSSNLNFHLQMSPFSAQISLKKSLIVEKSGIFRLPPNCAVETPKLESDIELLAAKNNQLEKDLKNLKSEFDRVVVDCHEAHEKIKELEELPIKKENENIVEKEYLQVEIKRVSTENFKYSEIVKEQLEEINELRNSIKMKTEISNQLNKKLSGFKIKSEKDSAASARSYKAEIKCWKKELGEERKRRMKLEEKLENINNKVDEKITKEKINFDLTITESSEKSTNPVCANRDDTLGGDEARPDHNICQHATQCVIRQPYPPPSPSSPFIVHDVSKYHEHMMKNTADDLAGCIKCFSVDNENYGCDKCTWLKWWFKWHGDRHGLPDIHPSVYKKYQ